MCLWQGDHLSPGVQGQARQPAEVYSQLCTLMEDVIKCMLYLKSAVETCWYNLTTVLEKSNREMENKLH
jgi:hypothetical protein